MTVRCKKTPILVTLLAITSLSICICLFTAAVLTVEEEATASRAEQPGLRPVKFRGSNRHREILNVGDDVARRRREELTAEEEEKSKIGSPAM